MSIKIKAITRINPRDPATAKRFYAVAVNQGDITLDSLSKQISMMSTVSKTDVYAVLIALTEVIPQALEEGKIVRLGNLGSFSVNVNSDSMATAEEVSSHNVKQLKLHYRPSAGLKSLVEAFHVEKV
ncbi:MAG: HU family DNA-binding protein [Bacteroidetes bacterium]|nr:HU family DNA-binding protein [Bacteroidota bacterium]